MLRAALLFHNQISEQDAGPDGSPSFNCKVKVGILT